MSTPTAGAAIVEALIAHGVSRAFCVPGESYLPVLDAFHASASRIDLVVCRHEATAAHMAEAHAKLTGELGVCLVTRGPGAAQAMIGVHTARQDSTPLLLLVGQIARGDRGREAFQEIDTRAAFAGWAKAVDEIDDPARTPEIMARAIARARQGRSGPVIVGMPEDALEQACESPILGPSSAPLAPLPEAVRADIENQLASAQRPLVILGGGGWTQAAWDGIAAFIVANALPVALSFRRKHLFDNAHPCFIGDLGLGANPALIARAQAADCVLAIGARLSDVATQGYTLWTPQETAERLVHLYPDPAELNRVWPARLSAVVEPPAAAAGLAGLRVDPQAWRADTAACRAALEAFSARPTTQGPVNPAEIFAILRAALPDDAIVCNGAGNYAAWLHRYFPHRAFATQLAPTSGAMGYGLPAAIAAKLARSEREVVAVAGDGCFAMAAHELATIAQRRLKLTILVLDNQSFGTIRMHQERAFPGRPVATDLVNPDFAALARAHGLWAATVRHTGEFAEVLAAARAQQASALIHLHTSLVDIAPGRALPLA